jgi:hypothetical protein
MLNKVNPGIAGMAGTCFYGDGEIVKQFLPAEILGMLGGMTEAMNIDTIKNVG